MVGLGLVCAQVLLVSLVLRLFSFCEWNTLFLINCGCGQWGGLTVLREEGEWGQGT